MQYQRPVIIHEKIRTLSVILLAFTSLLALNQTANALNPSAPYKLNGELQALGDVTSAKMSPDGKYLVYAADQDVNARVEIFSVPIEGGPATRLNLPLTVTGSNVFGSFEISPDSQRVVYLADSQIDGQFELFSVSITGGASVRLNANLPTGGDVSSFSVSPNSSRVVFMADQSVNDRRELYSIRIGGGVLLRLNSPLPAGADVISFRISPDSDRVVYIADQNTGGLRELYSVPIASNSNIRLNQSLFGNAEVRDFKISGDGQYVLYRADTNGSGQFQLYRVAIVGSFQLRINTSLPAGGNVSSYEVNPSASRIVYRADQNTNDVSELFSVSVSIIGITRIRLNEDLAVSGEQFVGDVIDYKISPDWAGLIYFADQDTDGVFELYYVRVNGGSVTRLNSNLPMGGDVVEVSFAFSPDSQRVVYQADQRFDNVVEIFSTSVSGGVPIRLNPDLPAGGDVIFDFEIAPDSSYVVYHAELNTVGVSELYLVPIDGGNSKRLNRALQAGADVEFFYTISSTSQHIVYRADQDVFDELEVFGVEILSDDEFCIPIKAINDKVVVICL